MKRVATTPTTSVAAAAAAQCEPAVVSSRDLTCASARLGRKEGCEGASEREASERANERRTRVERAEERSSRRIDRGCFRATRMRTREPMIARGFYTGDASHPRVERGMQDAGGGPDAPRAVGGTPRRKMLHSAWA